jgi:hypothetical protein
VKRNTSHNESKTRLYRTWKGIRGRCNNQNSKDYKHYGGRGIGLCAEWQEFEAFRDWALSNGYSDDLSIDRIDNDKGYSPDNCRWATQTEQTNNKSNNLHIEYRGETKTLAEWCRCLNLKYNIIHSRLNLGWTFGRAITEPVQKPHRKTIAGNPA